jgi:hypothetical protein
MSGLGTVRTLDQTRDTNLMPNKIWKRAAMLVAIVALGASVSGCESLMRWWYEHGQNEESDACSQGGCPPATRK